ncbi:DNA replication protein DnaC [Anaerolineales bacterium]|nr:DNA replication protein DnaC [Anaerolineales bacterium]
MRNDTRTVNSPSSSIEIETLTKTLGDPNCPHCGGAGYVRYDVPVGHEKFGKLESCVCRAKDVAESARNRLFAMSNLDRLSHLRFENFKASGNEKAKFMTPQERENLHAAFEVCEKFAQMRTGWILLEGGYGCGKTHLAAAIANDAVEKGTPTLFITVPDLLDSLRFAYNDPETTFEQRFEEIRNAELLILDDFGTQNATAWAQEKLFQIINFRYINKLATVITTNLMLDEIEGRIRSRLQDDEFVNYVKISAPDYRRPEETSNPGISMLSLPEMKNMTFKTFQMREDEIGKEAVTTTVTEKQDKFGNKYKDKEVTRIKVTKDDVKTLHDAFGAAAAFAEEPNGWLVLLGQSFCGKTHLAAAIGNYRIALGGQALLVEVSSLLDYLRQTFRPSSEVPFDRRFHEIRTTPLLILDDLKDSGSSSVWAEDKLYSVLNYRYNAHLPTVITSTMRAEGFALSYPNLWNKLLDPSMSQVIAINVPPYRRVAKGGKAGPYKKK